MGQAFLLLSLLSPGTNPTDQDVDFFEKKVRPVLVQHCYSCHSTQAKKAKGGLLLDSRDNLRKGGNLGSVLVPGKPDESSLIRAVRYTDEDLKMPPKGKLPDALIGDLEAWVKRGAPDPRTAPAAAAANPARMDIEAARQFWSFQLPRPPALPLVQQTSWPRNTIDQFILNRLEAQKLAPAPDADRYTLLRRVTFDLTGLPPTEQEIEAFLSDRSPQAFEKVVDRLLGSSAFGECWARHWLDLSCFADLVDMDKVARESYRYRDYVIAACNTDKPFDRFIHEQIAGDLLPFDSPAQRREQIVGTGFLAIGPYSLQDKVKPQLSADVVDHQIAKIGRAFLGLNLACVRCHSHKFDPIPDSDYYALAGIFHSTVTVFHVGPGWSKIVHTPLPELPEEAAARQRALQEYEKAVASIKQEREGLDREKSRLESHLLTLAQQGQHDGNDGARKADKELAEKQKKDVDRKLYQLNQRLLLVQYNRPRPPAAMAARDGDKPADSPIYLRGNYQTPSPQAVPRGFVQVATTSPAPKIPSTSSGRLEMAHWLTDAGNPLTARVTVNRLWHHLFGHGLVRSVDYFGTRGDRPSHPELLHYLALRLREKGWLIKGLIREMVLSRTYQMASTHNAMAMEVDPDNRLLWRMNRRRHDAEAIRDALLMVSGQLDRSGGGLSLGLDIPGNVTSIEGKIIPPVYTGKAIPESVRNRRTIYQALFRKRPDGHLEILNVFDFPNPDQITAARSETTVPTQALFLLNSPFLKEQADRTAALLLADKESADAKRVAQLYLRALSRPAVPEEIQIALRFLDDYQPPTPTQDKRREAWVQLCHALLTTNEFLLKE